MLGAWGLSWGVPSRKGWAPDELLPQDVLLGRAQGFSGGWYERYPPLHYRLLSWAYAPWLDGAPRDSREALPLEMHGRLTRVGRGLSLVFWLGLLSSVYVCGLRLLTQRGALIAAGLVALVLPLAFYAKLANLEVPYLSWWAASLPVFVRAVEGRRGMTLPLLALLAALSVTTKDQAYALFVLVPLPILLARLARQPPGSFRRRLASAALAWDVGLALLVGLCAFGLAHGLPWNWSGFRAHVEAMLAAGQAFRQFPPTLAGQLELLRAALQGLVFCLGWPAFALALSGVIASLTAPRDTRLLALLVPVASQHVFFLALVLYCYDRFLLPAAILLAFFAGDFADRMLACGGALRRIGALWLAATVVFGLSRAVSLDLQMERDGRYAVEEWLASRVRPDEAVGQLAPSLFLPRLKLQGLRAFGPDLEELQRERPRYLLMNVAYSRRADAREAERRFLQGLESGALGYGLALEQRFTPPWPLFDTQDLQRPGAVESNLRNVNPLIRVYERVGAQP